MSKEQDNATHSLAHTKLYARSCPSFAIHFTQDECIQCHGLPERKKLVDDL